METCILLTHWCLTELQTCRSISATARTSWSLAEGQNIRDFQDLILCICQSTGLSLYRAVCRCRLVCNRVMDELETEVKVIKVIWVRMKRAGHNDDW